MARELSVPLQTIYAELLERCSIAEMEEAFPEPGTFVVKQVRGRRYWYFQRGTDRAQSYVGPESEELLQRIAGWRQRKSEARERRELVNALRRAGVPGPDTATGKALKALAEGGVFRLRAVLVGTLAFQTYSPMLGLKLPGASLRTGDIDVAQLHEISVALEDATMPPLDLLRQADPSFRPVPSLRRHHSSFFSAKGVRVEFLAPRRRSEDEVWLKALHTHAQALPYLEYLLRDSTRAVVLTGTGVLVQVPDPARYAWHKIVIAPLRQNSVKSRKDIQQASLIIEHFLNTDPRHLRECFAAFVESGRSRRQLLMNGLERISPGLRDAVLALPGP